MTSEGNEEVSSASSLDQVVGEKAKMRVPDNEENNKNTINSKTNENNTENKPQQRKLRGNCQPIFFSHYFFFLFCLIITLIGIFASNSSTVGPFESLKDEIDFESTSNGPVYFVQLSDLHITNYDPERTARIANVFENISKFIRPNLLVITGDITDASTAGKSFVQVRTQYESNWIDYNTTLHKSGLFEAVGKLNNNLFFNRTPENAQEIIKNENENYKNKNEKVENEKVEKGIMRKRRDTKGNDIKDLNRMGEIANEKGNKHRPIKKTNSNKRDSFKKSFSSYSQKSRHPNIVEISGNHDSYGIISADSKNNFFLKYANHDVQSIQVESFFYPSLNLNIITSNPSPFPFLTAPMGNLLFLEDSLLDAMDANIVDDATNIVISHYPFYSQWANDMDKMKKVFSKNDILLTGHFHPQNFELVHFGKIVTVVGPALGWYNSFGIVTVEGNKAVNSEKKGTAVVYHNVNFVEDQFPIILVTFPIPVNQLSNKQWFNIDGNNFYVRAICFNNKNNNNLLFNVFIDGKEIGKLEKINSNNENNNPEAEISYLQLKVLNKNIKRDEEHKLIIKNGENKEILKEVTFFIGQKSPKIKESYMKMMTPNFFFGMIGTFAFLVLIRFIPFWLLCNSLLNEYEEFIFYDMNFQNSNKIENEINENTEVEIDESEEYEKIKEKFPFYKQLYIGPLYLICRLRNVPLSLYCILIFLFLWYIPFPMCFSTVEDKYIPTWCWGYIYQSNLSKVNETVWFLLLYYIIFLIPVIDICGILYENKNLTLKKNRRNGEFDEYRNKSVFMRLRMFQRVEFVLFCIEIVFALLCWIAVMVLLGGAFAVFTSLLFYIVIISSGIIFWKLFSAESFDSYQDSEESYL